MAYVSRTNLIVLSIIGLPTETLHYCFEAKVGKGKLLVSGIDMQSGLAERLEARQLC